MSISRYIGHVRRKFKYPFLVATALLLTATFAYYRSVCIEPVGVESLVELPKSPENRVAKKFEHQKHENGNQKYPPLPQSKGEFDTFDIYKSQIASRDLGNESTPHKQRVKKAEKLKVFILPFTHVDPGWLRTFDSYSEDTDKILNNMHSFLLENPKMRFMWAEFVFFERWWKKQSESVKKDVRDMVSKGQLELASGSWVMTDEANAYFPVSVDNIVEGQQFVYREFGIQSSVVWSNDPFGYSNTVPYLFKQAGLNRTVINRIHHGIKGYLQNNMAIPFRWRQYFDSSENSDVLTHVLPYSHYDIINSCGPEGGRCCEFDFKRITHWNCPGPKPVPITTENVKTKAETLMGQLEKMSKMYESNVLLMVHGDDFRFDMIEEWHQHHDNFLPLFEEINKGDRVEISFGTFTDYFQAMENWYEKKQIQPATLTGDFFPYKCALGDMWTGYFTTRPFYKRQGRLLHSMIRAGDLLSASVQNSIPKTELSKMEKDLETSRRTLSLFQHHDAITGTSKKHVMKDYSKLLFEAMNLTKNVIESSLNTATGSTVTMSHFPSSSTDNQIKVSLSMRDENSIFVNVYNPLPYFIEDTVSIRIDSSEVTVKEGGQLVTAQIEPYVFKGDIAQKTYLLTFPVSLQPLAISNYEIVSDKNSATTKIAQVYTTAAFVQKIKESLPELFAVIEIPEDKFGLNTDKLKTYHDATTGMMNKVSSASIGSHLVTSSFVAYNGAHGGAYLMRVRNEPTNYIAGAVPKMLVKGAIQHSVHLFIKNVYQRITAKNVPGPLGEQLDFHLRVDIGKERNTELAMRIETHMENAKFYADSVGMQLLRREYHSSLDIPSNYYPMPSAAVLENSNLRLTVSSNVEHGVMPVKQHGMEIMLDRMLVQDDGKGLGQSEDAIPTDLHPVDMQFSLLFEKGSGKPSPSHYSAHTPSAQISVQNILYPSIVSVAVANPSHSLPPLPALPCDYQLLTIRPISDRKRLMIVFRNGIAGGYTSADGCGTDLNSAIRELLTALHVKSVQTTNLSGIHTSTEEIDISKVEITLEPFKFASFILNMK